MSAFTYQVFRGLRTNVDRWRSFESGTSVADWGVDGDPAVFKNSKMCLKDQNGLYHAVLGCYVVDGQTQLDLDNTAYTYANIP
jgi:hypothetical protein